MELRRPALLVALLLAVAGLPALTGSPAVAAEAKAGQATYVPLEPSRLLDTRTTGTPVGPGGTVDVVVTGRAGVPAGATAVVLNVTATAATGATDVRAYPRPATGSAVPLVSSLNLGAGQTVANLVHVAVGAGGAVRLRNAAGSVHLLADVSGYYAGGGAGSSYQGVSPRRLLDTRDAGAPLAAGEVRTLRVRGTQLGAPAGASAVVLNVTAVGATQQTDVRVWPTRAGAPPLVSNLNPAPGRETPAAVVVAVGADDTVSLRSAAGSVHLVVDLSGWYVPSPGGDVLQGVFRPVAPQRLLDTRSSGGPVVAGEARALTVAGAGVVPAPGTNVVLNVTSTGATSATNVRVYPKVPGGAVPRASNLNVVAGQTLANAVVAQVGADGQVLLRNAAGSTHLVVDLAGWFSPAGDGYDISWPQCRSDGSFNQPPAGAFAVIGLTRRVPFTDNECFAREWAWAQTLPGEPMVYINMNAPGVRDRSAVGNRVWEELCGTGLATSTCGLAYGERIAAYALARMPTVARHGGKPMVWMDVEGPYANGPFWQQEQTTDPLAQPNPNAVAVNRAVIQGVVDGLRRAGHRIGTYSDRGSVADPNNDWRAIVGEWRLLQMQNWVFRSPDADPRTVCGPVHSFSGGPVVMAQVQPATNPSSVFDVNALC